MKYSHKLASAASVAVLSVATSAWGSLLVQYNFDEASSGTTAALDGGVAPAANGTLGGASMRTANTPAGTSLGALDTNGGGTSSYVSAGDAAKLDGLSQVTVAMWLNLQATPGQYDRLVSDHDANDGWEIFIDNPGGGSAARSAANFRLAFTVDTVAGPMSADISADNTWVFIAATYDGTKTSGNVNFYYGGLAASVALSGNPNQNLNAGPSDVNAADFRIGSTARTTNDRTPDALFDDVRVYNELLTPAQLDGIRLASVPEPAMLGIAGLSALGLLRRRPR